MQLLWILVGAIAAQRKFVGDYTPGKPSNQVNVNEVPQFNMTTSELLFEDNFDNLDMKKWRHELTLSGGANWEFQQYVNNRTNTYTKDGVLYLHPTLTSETLGSEGLVRNGGTIDIWGNMPNALCTSNMDYGCSRTSNGQNILNPIQSAQLRSFKSFSFKYGKVEIRARLPKGDWLWPALWLLPTDHAYGNWPASGEIDLLESRGNTPGYVGGGHDSISSTLHWGPDWSQNRYELTTASRTLPGGQSYADSFHTYTLEWSPNAIVTKVDGEPLLTVPINQSFWNKGVFSKSRANPWEGQDNAAPFNQDFSIIINLAVGGTNGFFPESPNKPWSNKSPTAAKDFLDRKGEWYSTWAPGTGRAFAIDYVRVFKMA